MRKSWADASRAADVRHAARSWREAEAIDAATLAAIDAAYPDPRPVLSPAWRVLIFVLVSVAANSVFFGAVELIHLTAQPLHWILFGALLAASTEALRGSRFAGNGSDAATSFWAILYALFGLGLHLLRRSDRDFEETLTVMLVGALLLFGAACFRWGYSAYGAIGTVALYGLLARFPAGRLAWLLVALILIAASVGRLDRLALAPPHRRAWGGVLAVSALALYAAVNRYSVDRRLVESLQEFSRPGAAPTTIVGVLSSGATALLPVLFLAWGIRARRTLVLYLGLVFTALSLVTLRHYVYLAPLWALLSAAGAALILGALWLNRYLRMRGGELGGFTAAPIFGTKRGQTLQAAAFVAGFANAPSPGNADRGDLSTGGGRFGGGGATGDF
jgi:hypothetical protein